MIQHLDLLSCSSYAPPACLVAFHNHMQGTGTSAGGSLLCHRIHVDYVWPPKCKVRAVVWAHEAVKRD